MSVVIEGTFKITNDWNNKPTVQYTIESGDKDLSLVAFQNRIDGVTKAVNGKIKS